MQQTVILGSLGAVMLCTSLYLVVTVPLWVAMLVNSVAAIVVGSLLSIRDGEDKKTDGDADEGESIGSKEALRFPIVASSFLVVLYVLVKYINKDLVNLVLSVYFTFLGICCLKGYLRIILGPSLIPVLPTFHIKHKVQIPYMTEPLDINFDACDLVTYLLTGGVGFVYFMTRFWMLNNLLAFAFAIYGVQKISISSFKIGALLLGGLFLYDIFWVYGTDVMLTVAKNIDAPIKLLFPKAPSDIVEGGYPYALLGLGDIIIPGVFLSLAYRFDCIRGAGKKGQPVYFLAGLASYVLGLVITMIVMKIFNAGQPALLYLVPSALGFVYGTAVLRGELKVLMSYQED